MKRKVLKNQGGKTMDYNYIDNAKEKQFNIMKNWFFERFEDPVENTSYDSREGGYMYAWGGPYDAYETLIEEFEDVFPEEIIMELAEMLSDNCVEWEGIPTEEDLDFDFEYITEYGFLPINTFNEAINEVKSLRFIDIGKELGKAYYSMLFIKTITIIETYLSDKFIYEILNNKDSFKTFFEKNKDFNQRKIQLSEIYITYERLEEIAKRYLGDLIWHKLPKVSKLYMHILEVDFQVHVPSLAKDIVKRHDLVHRNGKDKEGSMIEITLDDVDNLINKVVGLCEFIEEELAK